MEIKFLRGCFWGICLLIKFGYSQTINIIETKSISPYEVITTNYSNISILNNENKFDLHNPFTNLVLLTDEKENIFHILYQTDFEDNIKFLSISNNIATRFNCKGNPYFKWNSCIKEAKNSAVAFSIIKNILDCIIDRINECKDP